MVVKSNMNEILFCYVIFFVNCREFLKITVSFFLAKEFDFKQESTLDFRQTIRLFRTKILCLKS